MKKIIFLIFSSLLLQSCTDDTANNAPQTADSSATQQKEIAASETPAKAWNGTSLSDTTIKQVQQAKYTYTQCIYTEAKKQGYAKIDSRAATDAIIKQCELDLANIRKIFINAGVPETIADRYLKKTRVEMTRKILKSLIFAEAARKSGAIQ